jgi:hypothetical protein
MTYNYTPESKTRKLVLEFESGKNYEIIHNTPSRGTWNYHIVDGDLIKFDVYEDDRFLYSESNENIKSSIIFY